MTTTTTATIDATRYDAVIFDLDGVITDTASVHMSAWRQLFDGYLASRPDAEGEGHGPFTDEDYLRYVDGKPRLDGVASFLGSRGISLPWGDPGDGEDVETVTGLGTRKNAAFLDRLDAEGVDVFWTTVDLVRALQGRGLGTAVFSSSRNCAPVLERAGLGELFPVRIDGVVAAELGLPGKPDPATLLEATSRLGAEPDRTVVVEDAQSGVEAGRRGGFGLVIGVDRGGQAEALEAEGADVVVADLGDVDVEGREHRPMSEVPDADDAWDWLTRRLAVLPPVLFLDFDGTLSDIVDEPTAAQPVEGAREVLERLDERCPVAIVSGRDLRDVRSKVGLDRLWYAGSHGFELAGPGGEHHEHEAAAAVLPALDQAEQALRQRLDGVPGAIVERKRFAVSAHYRRVHPDQVELVTGAVDELAEQLDGLRATGGRRIAELRPDEDWDKGRAIEWLLGQLAPGRRVQPVYAGDDLTDEDALAMVRDPGVGIVVRSDDHADRSTAAHVAVADPSEMVAVLGRLADGLPRPE